LLTGSSAGDALWAPRPERQVVYPVVFKLLLRWLSRIREDARWNAFLAFEILVFCCLYVVAFIDEVWWLNFCTRISFLPDFLFHGHSLNALEDHLLVVGVFTRS
jgi:hypothetical protein